MPSFVAPSSTAWSASTAPGRRRNLQAETSRDGLQRFRVLLVAEPGVETSKRPKQARNFVKAMGQSMKFFIVFLSNVWFP